MINQIKNPTFGGFKPNAMQRIAGTLGYTGDMSGFQEYLNQNPDKQAQMDQFKQAAMTMARGGAVQKFQAGGAPNPFGASAPKLTDKGTYFKDGVEYTPQLGFGGAQAIPTAQLNQQQPAPQFGQRTPMTSEEMMAAAQKAGTYTSAETAKRLTTPKPTNITPTPVEGFGVSKMPTPTPTMYDMGTNITTPQITEPPLTTMPTKPISGIGQPVPLPIDPRTGKPPEFVGGPALPVEPPTQQPPVPIGPDTRGEGIAPQPPKTTQGTQLLQTPQGNFTFSGRPAQQADGTTRMVFTIKDDTGRIVGTDLTSADFQKWTQDNQATAYDPSQGMPEPLSEDVINQYTADVPSHFNTELKEMFTSGKLPADPTDYTISGSSRNWTITYGDGTTIKNRARQKTSVENDAANIIPNYINEFKNSPEYTQNKAQQDAYRKYLTEQTTGGVTGDIENIEQEYTNAQSNYTQLNLELQRLSDQAKANPDDPYLKELVEAKGKEFSDAKSRLDQLTPLYQSTQTTIKDVMTERATDPTLPEGAKVDPTMIQQDQDQFIQQGVGQVSGEFGVSEVAQANTYLSQNVDQPDTAKYEADVAADKVAAQTQALQAAQTDEDDARAKVAAATATASMVGDLNAAQGTATLMENEVQREIQDGELVSGAAADATKAAKFTEQIDAATATPSEKATVQGQLVGLMEQFEGTTPPPWAAGAVRLANQQMAARGLSASSMAGQAIMQAAMESALPIAQADAATQAQFESQNLSNRQARAMLAAEQRAKFLGQEFDQEFQTRVLNASKISDIANMNFTADQQVQLENARAVQTMNLENLSNRQAMVLAEASALANLDMGNLNNRQQTSVQNAQNFLQMDMANLSNEQQTAIFKSQQNINAMLTDQAARNAQMQFNAQSENQANQFYDNLNSTINMFNAEQQNAQERFNAGQVNAANQFNAEMKNQREQFNAQNQLVVDQSNAQWRREIATADTAAINRANELNAINTLDISNSAYNNMWQLYGDQMEWAINSYESEADRLSAYSLELLRQEGNEKASKYAADAAASASIGKAIVSLMTAGSDTILGGIFS